MIWLTQKRSPTARRNSQPGPVAAADPAVSAEGSTAGPAQTSQKEGQINELICGHPPSVMFTLTVGDEQFLFRVKDVAKIRVFDAAGNTSEAASCGKWK